VIGRFTELLYFPFSFPSSFLLLLLPHITHKVAKQRYDPVLTPDSGSHCWLIVIFAQYIHNNNHNSLNQQLSIPILSSTLTRPHFPLTLFLSAITLIIGAFGITDSGSHTLYVNSLLQPHSFAPTLPNMKPEIVHVNLSLDS
jgi:hypothetical protein